MSEDIAIAERIVLLLAKYLTKHITTEEQKELNAWIAESEDNNRQFQRLTDVKFLELERRRKRAV